MTRFRIKQNAWGNWYGYAGTKKVEQFFGSPDEQEQAANEWLAAMTYHPSRPAPEPQYENPQKNDGPARLAMMLPRGWQPEDQVMRPTVFQIGDRVVHAIEPIGRHGSWHFIHGVLIAFEGYEFTLQPDGGGEPYKVRMGDLQPEKTKKGHTR